MKRFAYLLVIIFACVSFSGCHLLWKRYHSKNSGFSISIPRWWTVDNAKPPMALVVLAPSQGKNDKFRENLTVAVADLNNQDEKELFWETNRKLLVQALPGYKSHFKEGEIFAGILKGQTFELEVENQGLHLKIKTAVWFKNLRVFVVTYTTEHKYWNKYYRTFDKIMSSFRY